MNEKIERLKGKLIVSCQALPHEPLHSSFIMGRMARAAAEGGAMGIRANTKEDIKDALLELRIAKYIRYNSETNMLEANAVPYDKWNEEEYEL